jgi:multiple sugar transport system substrate-binding protein
MKTKKLVSILITFTLVISLFSGFTLQTKSAAAPVKIDFWGGWTGPDAETMKGLVNKYNASQDKVNVTFTSLQWTPLFAKFLTEMKGGTPPDVLAMHPFEIGQFAEMGVLDPATVKLMNMDPKDYSAYAWNGTKYKNVQYGVPLDVHMHAVFYNKNMYTKAGITTIPSTGKQLIDIAQKLTIDKNGKHPNQKGYDENNVVQYGLGFAMNHHVFYQIYALINQQGSNPFTETMTSLNLDINKTAKAIQFIEDLIYKYKVVPKGEKSSVDDFIGSKVAMIIDGPWQIPKVQTAKFKWGTTPYPRVFDKQVAWGAAELLTFPVNKNADASKKQAAVDFVKWIDANSGAWAVSGQLPASKAGMAVAKTMPGRIAFIGSLTNNSVLLPANPKATQIFSSVAPSPILTAAQDAVLNNKNATDIAKQLKKDIDAILEDN